MVNVMKFIREKKEQIKEYSKKRDFEADLKRQKEMEVLKEKKAYYERKEKHAELKAEVRAKKYAPLTNLAKRIGKNVHEANKKIKKNQKKKVSFGQNKTRWG